MSKLDNLRNSIGSFFLKQNKSVVSKNELMEALFKFIGMGQTVMIDDKPKAYIEQGYNRNSWLGSVIDRIANTGSNIPRVLMELDLNTGELKEVDKNDFLNIKKPNENLSWDELINLQMKFDLITGNDFTYAIKNESGLLKGRVPVDEDGNGNIFAAPPQDIDIIAGNMFEPVKGYKMQGSEIILSPERVLHIKRANTDFQNGQFLWGASPLKSQRETIATSNNANQAQNASFSNGGIRAILGFPGITNQEQLDRVKQKFKRDTQGASNRGKIHVTGNEYNLTELGNTAKDMGVLESELQTLRKFCAEYSVSSGLFNDPKGSTYNNKREEQKAFYTDAVLPNLNRYLIPLSDWLLKPYSSEGKRLMWMPDISKIEALSHNMKETWEWLRNAWDLTGNEKRKIAGFEESEDDSMNQIMYPSNWFPIDVDLDDDQKAEKFLNSRNINDYEKA
jgi:HK97 family phage portal protein